jgi:hypothetical protein
MTDTPARTIPAVGAPSRTCSSYWRAGRAGNQGRSTDLVDAGQLIGGEVNRQGTQIHHQLLAGASADDGDQR